MYVVQTKKQATKEQIEAELKTKRAQTKKWYIVIIERESKKVWFWDFTEKEFCGRPLPECTEYNSFEDAYKYGACFGFKGWALPSYDIYIVHAGKAKYLKFEKVYFECDER